MTVNSKIEWTHHTFNPWWGCTNVSEACDNCYAHTLATRYGHDVWGSKSPRRFFGEKHWDEPRKWNKDAKKTHQRESVFCASMADVFETREDLNPWRKKLWPLIEQTTNLDWLLLTKRPHRISRYSPWGNKWPENVWLGTTVEQQKYANKRIDKLLDNPAETHFLSCEPLLGPIDLEPWLDDIDWVIVGGESGHGARPMNPDWVEDLRDQCIEHNTAFFFKQWGCWAPLRLEHSGKQGKTCEFERKGSDSPNVMEKMTKKAAGRLLDGRTWNEVPKSYYTQYNSIRIYTDGGARGNPGPSAIGYVILDEHRELIFEKGKHIGFGTNNEAEYKALIRALKRAQKYTDGDVICYSDSQLMVNQLNGDWKIKDPKLKALADKIVKLVDDFDSLKLVHVRRADSGITRADKLLNAALNGELYSSKRLKKA